MNISRGKRNSLIVKAFGYRVRIVPGRFRWNLERTDYGALLIAGKLFLITAWRVGKT